MKSIEAGVVVEVVSLVSVAVEGVVYGGAGWSMELILRIDPGRAVMRKFRRPRWRSMPFAVWFREFSSTNWCCGRVLTLVFVLVEMMLEARERREIISGCGEGVGVVIIKESSILFEGGSTARRGT